MGQSLTSTFSPYGINGAVVDATQNNKFCGLRWGTGETVLFTELVTPNDHLIVSEFDDLITAVKLLGPPDSLSMGSIVFTDRTLRTYTFPCSISTGNVLANPSLYQAPYTVSSTGEVIGSMGIATTDAGLTVLCDMSSTNAPESRTLTFDNTGVVGWIKQGKEFVGTISDGGQWRLWSDVTNIQMSSLTPFYFPKGYLLSSLRIRRISSDPRGGNSPIGRAEIEFMATNGIKYSAVYKAEMSNVLGVNSLFQSGWPTSVNNTTQVGNVMASISYWLVTGVTSQREDFLVKTSTFKAYVAPDVTSYGPEAQPSDECSSVQEHHENNNPRQHQWGSHRSRKNKRKMQSWIMFLTFLVLIAGIVGGAIWYNKSRKQKDQSHRVEYQM